LDHEIGRHNIDERLGGEVARLTFLGGVERVAERVVLPEFGLDVVI